MKQVWLFFSKEVKVAKRNVSGYGVKRCLFCRQEFQSTSKFGLFCEDCKAGGNRCQGVQWLPAC